MAMERTTVIASKLTDAQHVLREVQSLQSDIEHHLRSYGREEAATCWDPSVSPNDAMGDIATELKAYILQDITNSLMQSRSHVVSTMELNLEKREKLARLLRDCTNAVMDKYNNITGIS